MFANLLNTNELIYHANSSTGLGLASSSRLEPGAGRGREGRTAAVGASGWRGGAWRMQGRSSILGWIFSARSRPRTAQRGAEPRGVGSPGCLRGDLEKSSRAPVNFSLGPAAGRRPRTVDPASPSAGRGGEGAGTGWDPSVWGLGWGPRGARSGEKPLERRRRASPGPSAGRPSSLEPGGRTAPGERAASAPRASWDGRCCGLPAL